MTKGNKNNKGKGNKMTKQEKMIELTKTNKKNTNKKNKNNKNKMTPIKKMTKKPIINKKTPKKLANQISKAEYNKAVKICEKYEEFEDQKEVEQRKNETYSKVGTYFKYSDRYSVGDEWWVYGAFTSIDDNGELVSETYQLNNYGEVEIKQRVEYSYDYMTQITKEEFEENIAKILSKLEYLPSVLNM